LQQHCAGAGAQAESVLSAGLFKFSTVSMEWTDLSDPAVVTGTGLEVLVRLTSMSTSTISVLPDAMAYSAMTAIGTDIYLFGGYKGPGEEDSCSKTYLRWSRSDWNRKYVNHHHKLVVGFLILMLATVSDR